MSKVSKQYKSEDGEIITHTEARSRKLKPSRVVADMGPDIGFMWENDVYYGTLRTYTTGCALTGGAWAVIGITAKDETARQDRFSKSFGVRYAGVSGASASLPDLI